MLVRYSSSGGLSGHYTIVTVDRDGSATRAVGRSPQEQLRIAPRTLRALKRDLRDARFGDLRRRYAPATPVADGVTETVRHRGRAVEVQTGGRPPERLQRVLRRLRRIAR